MEQAEFNYLRKELADLKERGDGSSLRGLLSIPRVRVEKERLLSKLRQVRSAFRRARIVIEVMMLIT